MITLDLLEAIITGVLSSLSLIGSILVLISYYIAATKSNPKIASKLIRNLAISDCIWFLATCMIAGVWVFGEADGMAGSVPDDLCFVASPMVGYGRMSSLFWTCCISFDLLQSIIKRSKATKRSSLSIPNRTKIKKKDKYKEKDLENEVNNDTKYSKYYRCSYPFVIGLSIPGPILTILIQHTTSSGNLGCNAGYEEMGEWFVVTAVEVLPIFIGSCINMYIFIRIRAIMMSPSYPHSVKRRLRDVMYYYLVVCIICWSPTLVFYIGKYPYYIINQSIKQTIV